MHRCFKKKIWEALLPVFPNFKFLIILFYRMLFLSVKFHQGELKIICAWIFTIFLSCIIFCCPEGLYCPPLVKIKKLGQHSACFPNFIFTGVFNCPGCCFYLPLDFKKHWEEPIPVSSKTFLFCEFFSWGFLLYTPFVKWNLGSTSADFSIFYLYYSFLLYCRLVIYTLF